MCLFMDVIGLELCSGLLEGILSEGSELALLSVAQGMHPSQLACYVHVLIAPAGSLSQ